MKTLTLLLLSVVAAAIPSSTRAQALPPTCLQSSASVWTNRSLATQSAQFTVTYDATPSQANMSGVVGFSLNAATSYTSLAAITRFASSGMIDVRNGGAYSADVAVSYVAGSSYHFRLVINPITKRYNVYVTRPGQTEVALATNYAFRSEQSSTSSLNNWGMIANTGMLTVCSMAIGSDAILPTITTQPVSQTVIAGQTATFSVTATGTAPLTYQWRKNGVNISGATSSSCTTPVTTTADSGALFSVVVSDSAGSATSNAATLTVNAAAGAPAITTQPVSQTVTAGQTASFSVTATGTAPLSYQWRKNGVNISGATSSSYMTPVTTTADSGAQFSAAVSNSAGSTTSNAAMLTVNTASSCPCTLWPSTAVPAVIDQGPDSSVELGVTFRADSNGYITGIRFYKSTGNTGTHVGNLWSGTGRLLATATFSGESALGWQQVSFSNPVAITANTAYVASYHTNVGHFSVTRDYFATSGVDRVPLHAPANGSGVANGPFMYGSTSAFPTSTYSSSNYWVDVVFDNTTNPIPVAPAITTQPVSQTVIAGQTAIFSVTATGTAPLSYHWRKNGVNISGATSSSYTTPVTTTADSGAQFSVAVSNSAGSATSNAATLTVNATAVAPAITTQPTSRTVIAGQTATFLVTATGTAPMSYQWRKNGANISGATSSSYTTPVTTTADSGALFSVVVSNSAGSATSNNATLTVSATTRLLSANPTTLSFGNITIGTSSLLTTTLTNTGNSNVTISNVSMAGAGFNANGVSTGQILAPGQTATLNVAFLPTLTGGVTGSAVVTSNASNSPATIALSGTGVQLVSHSATLLWTASTSTVVGYHVYSGTISGGPYTKLTTTPIAATTYIDSNIQSGTRYYVVTAVDASSVESTYSGQASAVIP